MDELVTSTPDLLNLFDLPFETFSSTTDRDKNRDYLTTWINEHLKEGSDWGRIHVAGKQKCPRPWDCTPEKAPGHWSKPCLFKPGAEKLHLSFGLRPHYPTLDQYETAGLNGISLDSIVLRCDLLDKAGNIVGTGIGGRGLDQDKGDLNKTLKMVKKSALIDAVLSAFGLSEHFTQDLDDPDVRKRIQGENSHHDPDDPRTQPRQDGNNGGEYEFSRDFRLQFGAWGPEGKHTTEENQGKGTPLRSIDASYLEWLSDNAKQPYLGEFAKKELQERAKGGSGSEIHTETKGNGSNDSQAPLASVEARNMIREMAKDELLTPAEQANLLNYAKSDGLTAVAAQGLIRQISARLKERQNSQSSQAESAEGEGDSPSPSGDRYSEQIEILMAGMIDYWKWTGDDARKRAVQWIEDNVEGDWWNMDKTQASEVLAEILSGKKLPF